MGDAVLNTLTSIRAEIKDALQEAGIKAVEYVQANIVPPVAIVVPDDPYISVPTENTFYAPYTVSIQVLLIGPKATNQGAAEKIDSMIEDAVAALDDWDFTEVTAPGEMTLKNVAYYGAVLTLSKNTKITKEVM